MKLDKSNSRSGEAKLRRKIARLDERIGALLSQRSLVEEELSIVLDCTADAALAQVKTETGVE